MKYVKYIIITFFCVTLISYVINWAYVKKNSDIIAPKITIGEKNSTLKVSVKDKGALLKDIVAKDEKDGDITDKMVIESISKFVDKKKHICNVTYAVANSQGVVSKATRKVQFTDYRKPHFVLKEPLCFTIGSDTDIKSKIGATDVFDGDISDKVKILSRDMSTTMTGQYAITAQVTNSLGDTVTLKAIATIEQENNFSPTITLKKNIVYIKVGAKFNPKDYIESAKDGDGKTLSIGSIKVASSSVKTKKTGCYQVEYTVKDKEDNKGTAYLTVMVEE